MLAGKMFALVDDVANIDAVREQVIKRAAAEAAAAAMRPAGPALELGAITLGIELVGKRIDRGQLQIALHDVTDETGFAVVDHQLAVLDIIAERDRTAHPDALLLGSSDLVADALAGNLALELSERKQDIEGQAIDLVDDDDIDLSHIDRCE